MDICIPKPVWQGQNAYIIGGGPSLINFDWELLRGLNTIGCNDAYTLGEAICKVCVFGDSKWFYNHKDSLSRYKGEVWGAEPSLTGKLPEWVKPLKRYAKGLQTDGVGWNGNTGMVALNLAILFGAVQIYLLGFDMKRTPANSNWHENNLDKNPDAVYKKFLNWSKYVHQDWVNKFPHIKIHNVTDDSDLDIFPKLSVKEFWERKATA
jgi:hypothetical protein